MSGNRGERTTGLALFYLFALSFTALDQLSKFWILSTLAPEESYPLVPGIFHLTLIENRGIAFGLLGHLKEVLFLAITVSIALLGVWGRRVWIASAKQRGLRRFFQWECLAVAMIFGGALGNWIDRVRVGAVIDFLDFRIWPVFNVADSAITAGVVLYFISYLRQGQDAKKTEDKAL